MKEFLPGCGAYLALIGVVSIVVYLPGFDNIEDLFRVYIAANRALSNAGIHLVVGLSEVDHRLHRISIVNHMSPVIQDHHLVEHLKKLGRGLVDDHKYQLSFQGQFPKKVHHIFRIA